MSIPFAVNIPFVNVLGAELQRYEGGQAELTLQLREDAHTNSFGVAHGGVLMTLLDVVMAHAARSIHRHQPDGGPGLVTLEMKTSFMRPGLGLLTAHGSILHSTAKLAFCEGRVIGGDGELCAHATATFKFLRALPISGKEARPAAKPILQGPGSD
jgi:uncharacterized protein (TIGR00369 family)